MATSIFNNNVTTNGKALANVTNNAVAEVREARQSIMYFVHLLNKLWRKNEFVDGQSIHELGNMVRYKAISMGCDVPTSAPFNAYLFTKVNGVSCYKKTTNKKASGAFAVDVTIITWKNVTLSETGLIKAYKYILNADAKAADKMAREAQREARKSMNKAERRAKADAKKALKAEQDEARELYNMGKITVEQFADIMVKAA